MAVKFNLQRFVNAQDSVIDQVRAELASGRKTGHWMWFIFPQIKGLGLSETSRYFAISSREEATAYLDHPILGRRLRECTKLVIRIEGKSIDQILGSPDDLKFHSSMTLFSRATQDNEVFLNALSKYFGGEIGRIDDRLPLIASTNQDSISFTLSIKRQNVLRFSLQTVAYIAIEFSVGMSDD